MFFGPPKLKNSVSKELNMVEDQCQSSTRKELVGKTRGEDNHAAENLESSFVKSTFEPSVFRPANLPWSCICEYATVGTPVVAVIMRSLMWIWSILAPKALGFRFLIYFKIYDMYEG